MAPRRLSAVIALCVSVIVLAGCAGTNSSTGAAPTTASGDVRVVNGVLGETKIPTDPQNVVALDENAAFNLLSIGITPDVVYHTWNTAVPVSVLEAAGIETVERTWSGVYPEREEVASRNPDLIVATVADGQQEVIPDYASIAPTVGALYSAPWQDVVQAYGEYFDRADRAKSIIDTLEAKAAQIAQTQNAEPLSLSVVMSYPQYSMVLAMDATSPVSSIIADAGFARPETQSVRPDAQQSQGGWLEFSPEQLPAQDADVLAVASGPNYDPTVIEALPLFSSLEAVKNGRSAVIDGDFWSGGYAFSTFWVLDDLAAFASGENAAGSAHEADARWSAFEKLIGE